VHDPKAPLSPPAANSSRRQQLERRFQIPADGHFVLQDLPFGVYASTSLRKVSPLESDVVEVHSEFP